MYACESGNADCVKVLLENGASLNCSVSIVLILSISCIIYYVVLDTHLRYLSGVTVVHV